MTQQERNDVLEEAAQKVLEHLVIHGDHYAAYQAPSNDAVELANAIRSLKCN